MSDQPTPSDAIRTGQIASTPEGGPIDEGVPVQEPGAGQVRSTPEGGPLAAGDELVPPTWHEHMRGPVLGLDDMPQTAAPAAGARAEETAPTNESRDREERSGRAAGPDEELRKWPPYSGKPVSEVNWEAARRYAAPVAAQAEKLTIKAIDLSARGLSKLARYLEARRQERHEDER
jgi:hypothetical protein